MASPDYHRMMAWARQHKRPFSSTEVAALLAVSEQRAWGLVNAAHSKRDVRRAATKGDWWVTNG